MSNSPQRWYNQHGVGDYAPCRQIITELAVSGGAGTAFLFFSKIIYSENVLQSRENLLVLAGFGMIFKPGFSYFVRNTITMRD